MNVFSLFLAEMAKLAAKKGVLISIIAALLVPVVYGAILLSPTWGPYDNLSNLPVAVVNNDKGAMSGDEAINVGKDLIADLKKGKDLGWKFVDTKEARKGLDSFKYYMIVEIPEDFSERVTTVLDPDPKKLELNYIQNEGLNFMAAQVTRSATEKLREKLANKVTEKYVTNIFASLGDVSAGFKTAADGSAQLHDGTTELHGGTNELLQSLTDKSTDITKLANGAMELEKGTGEMVSSLSSKQKDITKLAIGSMDLKNGTGQLLSSLNDKSDDISKLAAGSVAANAGTGLLLQTLKDKQPGIKELAAGGNQLAESVPKLKVGTAGILEGLKKSQLAVKSQLQPGTQGVAAGITQIVGQSKELAVNLNNLSVNIQTFYNNHPELQSELQKILLTSKGIAASSNDSKKSEDLLYLQGVSSSIAAAFQENTAGNFTDGINKMVAGQTDVDNGVTNLVAKAPLLKAGTADVENGWSTLIQKVAELNAGTSQIAEGNKTVHTGWGTITSGVKQLDNGATQISTGNATVEKGWRDLTSGASKIHSGVVQVSDGNSSVEKGWRDLTEGVTKLNDGAGKLNAGSNELATGLKDGAEESSKIKADDENISMFASPVELISDTVHKYPLYRDSTAPYVLSLSLFVGILIMSLFIEFKKPDNVSTINWFGAKFLNLSALAICQTLLLSIVVLLFLNMDVQNSFGFVLFAIVVSIVFSGIVLFFASFGNIGRFFAFAIVVLQLSTTGANLPIDMLPENLRALSEFLPFTYSIIGFKSLISLNDFGLALANMGILLVYLAVFGLLAFTVFFLKSKSLPHETDIAA